MPTLRPRRAARVVLLDETGRVLLLRGFDPARPEAGSWWITPGGGLEQDESFEQAAVRELAEETGLQLPHVDALGERTYFRTASFSFEGVDYEQLEVFYVVHTTNFDIDRSRWTDVEHRSVSEHRWWSREELVLTDETFHPDNLIELMSR